MLDFVFVKHTHFFIIISFSLTKLTFFMSADIVQLNIQKDNLQMFRLKEVFSEKDG